MADDDDVLSPIAVDVSYTLTKSDDVTIAEHSFVIGGTPIDLDGDEDDDDPNKFASPDGQPYNCTQDADGLQVTLRATGHRGSSWTLNVTVDGSPLHDNPITVEADNKGRLNHDQTHH
jgi:hypothetical protein